MQITIPSFLVDYLKAYEGVSEQIRNWKFDPADCVDSTNTLNDLTLKQGALQTIICTQLQVIVSLTAAENVGKNSSKATQNEKALLEAQCK